MDIMPYRPVGVMIYGKVQRFATADTRVWWTENCIGKRPQIILHHALAMWTTFKGKSRPSTAPFNQEASLNTELHNRDARLTDITYSCLLNKRCQRWDATNGYNNSKSQALSKSQLMTFRWSYIEWDMTLLTGGHCSGGFSYNNKAIQVT